MQKCIGNLRSYPITYYFLRKSALLWYRKGTTEEAFTSFQNFIFLSYCILKHNFCCKGVPTMEFLHNNYEEI